MAALPLPAAILDDLIPGTGKLGMRSSKMAAGSGRAAILRLRLNGDRKGRPILLIMLLAYGAICFLLVIAWHRKGDSPLPG